jgi:TonB family protein
MIVRIRSGRLRSSASFAVSACFHGGILGWVALGPERPAERPRSIYDQEIRPSEKKIVWYNLREKLPEVAPADAPADPRPPRARVKFDQTLVSGPKDDDRPPQMIFLPDTPIDPPIAPPPDLPKPAPLPNVVAVAAPKPVRLFVPPPVELPPDKPAPALPEAPRPAAAGHSPTDQVKLPFAVPAPRLQPRAFTPPAEAKLRSAPVSLPDAPRVVGGAETPQLLLAAAGPKPQPLPFAAPPEVRLQRQAALLLPDAPAFSSSIEIKGGLPIAAPMPRPQPMAFTPPSHPQPASAAAAPATLAEAPAANVQATAQATAQATLAIVGLNPANTTSIPAPPGPREAGFSAGTLVRPEGGSGGASDARIAVPGLLVRGGVKDDQPSLVANFSPTSRENLLAAARIAMGSPPPPAALPKTLAGEPQATRVAGAPGARLNGRLVYTVAIQMPNVTSYSGSWIVWFALREQSAAKAVDPTLADVRPPVPLRKVDPKYIRSAVDDRVEGKVLLSAVIRADGLVESVGVISGLDRRLDSSAAEALGKWVFEPATRNGAPVMVDAVFEIPFHLAPKPAK